MKNEKRKKEFLEKFYNIAKVRGIDTSTPQRPTPINDSLLVSWIDKKQKRVLRVQESEHEKSFKFDSFISKSGMHSEIDDVCIIAKNAESDFQVELVLEIFKKWFLNEIPPEEMEHYLDHQNSIHGA